MMLFSPRLPPPPLPFQNLPSVTLPRKTFFSRRRRKRREEKKGTHLRTQKKREEKEHPLSSSSSSSSSRPFLPLPALVSGKEKGERRGNRPILAPMSSLLPSSSFFSEANFPVFSSPFLSRSVCVCGRRPFSPLFQQPQRTPLFP